MDRESSKFSIPEADPLRSDDIPISPEGAIYVSAGADSQIPDSLMNSQAVLSPPLVSGPPVAPPPATRLLPPSATVVRQKSQRSAETKPTVARVAPPKPIIPVTSKQPAKESKQPVDRGNLPPLAKGLSTLPIEKDAEGDVWEQIQKKRAVPSWLVSFIVHVLILLILAAAPIARYASGPLTILLGSATGSPIASFELASDSNADSVQTPEEAQLVQVQPTFSTLDLTQTLDSIKLPMGGSSALSLEELGLQEGFSGRSGSLKSALLLRYGGTPGTEAAVEAGLQWLVRNQRGDGGWSLKEPFIDGASLENRTAATAMALNAFLGAGYSHKSGKYQEVVGRGLKFLLTRQDTDGFFGGGEPSRQKMYAQAIATIAICEAYGMTGDSNLRLAATRAIDFAEWSQSKQFGWRYEPREDSDLSVAGWFLMGLMTGKMAGLKPDEKKIQNVGKYLDKVQSNDAAHYAYKEFDRPSLSMTAVGLLCRQYLGWPNSHPALLDAIANDLLPNYPRKGDEMYSVYFWYYATQVLHHAGGDAWKEWNSHMREVLPALQVHDGREAGSWDPGQDQFGASGGRLYTTCFTIYCLEVYYRHLSLYDLDKRGL